MDDKEQKKQAMITTLRILAASPKSRRDLEQKLSRKGYPEPVIAETLRVLEQQKSLDDRAYAQNLASRYRFSQPSGRQRITFELKKRGIPKQVCDEVVSGMDAGEEAERAREAARLRWERLKTLPDDKRKKRVYDFLLRRGFDFQLVREVTDELSKTGIDD